MKNMIESLALIGIGLGAGGIVAGGVVAFISIIGLLPMKVCAVIHLMSFIKQMKLKTSGI